MAILGGGALSSRCGGQARTVRWVCRGLRALWLDRCPPQPLQSPSLSFCLSLSLFLSLSLLCAHALSLSLSLSLTHTHTRTRTTLTPAIRRPALLCLEIPHFLDLEGRPYGDTSLIRNSGLEPYRRTMHRALWWVLGGGHFFMSEVPLS